jgi:predicted nucleic acid-binding protein
VLSWKNSFAKWNLLRAAIPWFRKEATENKDETMRDAYWECNRGQYSDRLLSPYASALETGCNIVYSEDLQDGQVIEKLTIRNPFRS